MKNYEPYLFPIFLIAIGLVTVSGVDIFGAAMLEGAAWKQNVMLALMLIFGMLPPAVQGMKSTWMVIGYALAFFMFGGANIGGTVGIVLGLEKLALAVLALFLGFRVWAETWAVNKWYMAAPACAVIAVALLCPIQDQNIIGSGIDALVELSAAQFTSDHGFHLYLGLTGIFAGISELLIRRCSHAAVADDTPAIDIAAE